jgi:DNA-binding SARP family transcriptional activator/tetratricopeptide (TPR) repeat protein
MVRSAAVSEGQVQVRLLGPVDVLVSGAPRPVHGTRRKSVLAVLALRAGEVVSTDHLVDVVWAGNPPPTAAATLQNHVSYLRGLLGARSAIVARAPGYQLAIGPEATDVVVAERLIQQGEQTVDATERVDRLRAAVALWRGRPLADVAGHQWMDQHAERLADLRLVALHAVFEARLDLGEHDKLLPELGRLADENPYDEQFCGQLMRALYRCGRQADALARYQNLRRSLGTDLGIAPSPVLRDLVTRILHHDDTLGVPPSAGAALFIAPDTPVPAQLPPAVHGFAGREREIDRLDATLAGCADDPTERAPVVISVISGTAGVGKTALVLHWAHRVSDRFPDGQLYVNLRGFDPGGSVLDPSDAIRGFIGAFGVPAERVPADLDAQVALYRSTLAGRKVLVVLDNARDAEQVQPLLPGTPGCRVLVTSRDQLAALVATLGAHPLTLDLLDADGARELLGRRVGPHRLAAEPEAVDGIVAACAGLPLALAIVAARAAVQPGYPLAWLATQLREAGGLDGFDDAGTSIDLRAVFSWSYDTLSPPAARLFRRLGLHCGPDVSAQAAASLAGITPAQARRLLAELTGTNLLDEHRPGRYTFHDLLRAYATEQAHAVDSEQDRHAAVGRVLDHYLHTAYAAAQLADPHRDPITVPPPTAGVTPEVPADGLAWLTGEHPVLFAAIAQAGRAGLDTHVWQLVSTLYPFLLRHARWHDWATVERAALAAAQRLGDVAGQARAHRGIGGALARLGHQDDADRHHHRALRLYHEAGDLTGQGRTHLHLGLSAERRRQLSEAVDHGLRARDLFRTGGNENGHACALNYVGRFYARLGDPQPGLAYLEEALARFDKLDDRDGQASAWDTIGYAHHQLGDHARAMACFHHALDGYRGLGDRCGEAEALVRLGETHLAAADSATARSVWRQALTIFAELAHPAADEVRAKLSRL